MTMPRAAPCCLPFALGVALAAHAQPAPMAQSATPKGSGRATLRMASAGGVIDIDAVAASGEKIAGKIQCNHFGAIHAEGG